MDLTESCEPKSDQLDAVDLLSGPRTFTVERVSRGNGEQPFNYHLAEFPRPWRPGKSMRRVLLNVWGADATQHAGRRLTLYCDNRVKFGGQEVGGVRISHMSGIEKAQGTPLIVSKGKSMVYVVQPLPDAPPAPTEAAVAASSDRDELRRWWSEWPGLRVSITARVAELDAGQEGQ
jgi:hypothetical protein